MKTSKGGLFALFNELGGLGSSLHNIERLLHIMNVPIHACVWCRSTSAVTGGGKELPQYKGQTAPAQEQLFPQLMWQLRLQPQTVTLAAHLVPRAIQNPIYYIQNQGLLQSAPEDLLKNLHKIALFSGTDRHHRACISKFRQKSQQGWLVELVEPQEEEKLPVTCRAVDLPWLVPTRSGAGGEGACRDGQAMKAQVLPSPMGWASFRRTYIKPCPGQATVSYTTSSSTSFERASPLNFYFFIFHLFPGNVFA
ncbi:hypothetical protein llap_13866 [Limosa lapponica baueri]|uniref:Uncharacterized protein n=1 Tax=Limosa lapponica baueri TaxID=1758121 RepID=A0A2I0TPW7_LIMLA|nr:hypothetical protein llap_13866 [Limosa lapponica baueri]